MYRWVGHYDTPANNSAWDTSLLGLGRIPTNAVNCHAMFDGCYNMGGGIRSYPYIPEKVEDASYMLNDCPYMSLMWNINNTANLVNTSHMFVNYGTHPHASTHRPLSNMTLNFSPKLINASSMFQFSIRNTSNVNQTVCSVALKFSGGAYNNVNLCSMFSSCRGLQNLQTIPATSTTFDIPYGAGDVSFMFNECINTAFPDNIIIPETVTSAAYMFNNCKNVNNIYFYANPRVVSVYGMLFRSGATKYVNIYCNDVDGLIAGNICKEGYTWTPITNGYTNAALKVNLYNNIPPYVMPS